MCGLCMNIEIYNELRFNHDSAEAYGIYAATEFLPNAHHDYFQFRYAAIIHGQHREYGCKMHFVSSCNEELASKYHFASI